MENKINLEKIKNIKLIISDVDGVLTDGKIYISNDGSELKGFSVEDGAGSAYARLAKIPVAFISGRFSVSTSIRAKEMGVEHCYQGKLNKLDAYSELLSIYNVSDEEVAYIGDGLIDMPILLKVGFACTVPDAHKKVIEISDYITLKKGGDGAFRELVELILTHKGIYNEIYDKMHKTIYKG
tara:strand:- start:175 stop:720 length:546 start_codon:yes stop_codon:yes gene_type:complete